MKDDGNACRRRGGEESRNFSFQQVFTSRMIIEDLISSSWSLYLRERSLYEKTRPRALSNYFFEGSTEGLDIEQRRRVNPGCGLNEMSPRNDSWY